MRLAGIAAGALIALGLFGTGLGLGELGLTPPLPDASAARGQPGGYGGPALPRSRPTLIAIPTIGVHATVEPVGLAGDGAIAVPALAQADQAGWYDRGPAPGENGPAVIVGHVDSRRGPGVFYRLGALRPGTHIEVVRRDRRVAVFRVDAVRRYPKSALPVDQLYGDRTHPGLRLITCGGRWVGGALGYADNIVVFATLVPS